MHAPAKDAFRDVLSDQENHNGRRDARLDRALSLLDAPKHRSRNGLLTLIAVVALGCSGTLLATIVTSGGFGASPQTAPMPRSASAAASGSAPADFELSGSSLAATEGASAGSESRIAQGPVKDAVLLSSEK